MKKQTVKAGDKFQVVNFLGNTLNYTVISLKKIGKQSYALVLNDFGCEVLMPVSAVVVSK